MPLNIQILYCAKPDQEEPFVKVCSTVFLFKQHGSDIVLLMS